MGHIGLEELSDSLKEYLKGLGLTENQVNEAIKQVTGDKTRLQTSNKNNIVDAINEVFQSGVNAKQGLVDALTSKNVEASTSDNWESLNNKVRNIKSLNTLTSKFIKPNNYIIADMFGDELAQYSCKTLRHENIIEFIIYSRNGSPSKFWKSYNLDTGEIIDKTSNISILGPLDYFGDGACMYTLDDGLAYKLSFDTPVKSLDFKTNTITDTKLIIPSVDQSNKYSPEATCVDSKNKTMYVRGTNQYSNIAECIEYLADINSGTYTEMIRLAVYGRGVKYNKRGNIYEYGYTNGAVTYIKNIYKFNLDTKTQTTVTTSSLFANLYEHNIICDDDIIIGIGKDSTTRLLAYNTTTDKYIDLSKSILNPNTGEWCHLAGNDYINKEGLIMIDFEDIRQRTQ